MNLYLKYRPKSIDELDLSGVRKVLSDIVKSNQMAHAYLLTGPRGAGKTSTARVLARVVNCEKNGENLSEPCNDCKACKSIIEGSAVDVIEIDAASNRGIDDIRELKEKIRLAPAILPTKVYIIDEVHMLTTEAFNALLKTLEEPPSHSLFILCTTELHKVPGTIISRCSQIQFTKATPEEMKRSFARVIKGEGVEAEEEALDYLSKVVDGSFRDGVKILGQVIANTKNIKLSDIETLISGSAGYKIDSLVEAIVNKDVSASLAKLTEATSSGVDLSYLIVNMMRSMRDRLIEGSAELEVTKLIFSLDEVARRLASSLDGELLLQVAIVEWCGTAEGSTSGKSKVIKSVKSESQKNEKTVKVESQMLKETVSEVRSSMPTMDASDIWKQVTSRLGQNNLALDTILSKAKPGMIQGDELTIYVQYDFHKQQLSNTKNMSKLEELISSVLGRKMRVICEVRAGVDKVSNPPTLEATEGRGDDIIDEAMAIFS